MATLAAFQAADALARTRDATLNANVAAFGNGTAVLVATSALYSALVDLREGAVAGVAFDLEDIHDVYDALAASAAAITAQRGIFSALQIAAANAPSLLNLTNLATAERLLIALYAIDTSVQRLAHLTVETAALGPVLGDIPAIDAAVAAAYLAATNATAFSSELAATVVIADQASVGAEGARAAVVAEINAQILAGGNAAAIAALTAFNAADALATVREATLEAISRAATSGTVVATATAASSAALLDLREGVVAGAGFDAEDFADFAAAVTASASATAAQQAIVNNLAIAATNSPSALNAANLATAERLLTALQAVDANVRALIDPASIAAIDAALAGANLAASNAVAFNLELTITVAIAAQASAGADAAVTAFALALAIPATGAPLIVDGDGGTPTEGSVLTVDTAAIVDANGVGAFSFQWQVAPVGTAANGVWTDIAGATAASFTPAEAQVNQILRVVVSFTDGLGAVEQLTSIATDGVGDLFVGGDGNDAPLLTAFDDIASGGDGDDTLDGLAGNDRLSGDAGADTINGGAGADYLTGGAGGDTIDTGAADDNLQDIILYTLAADFDPGDVINNFDATGATTEIDRVAFGGDLNTLFDDVTNDDIIAFVSGDGVDGGNTAVDLNTTAEALYLSGNNGEGVTNANLGSANAVRNEFNAEFALTAADGESTLLVINDTDGNSAAIWQFLQNGGGEINADELTLIGIVNANATVTVDNFAFVV